MDGGNRTNFIIQQLLEDGKLSKITNDMLTKALGYENYEILEIFLKYTEFDKTILTALCQKTSNSANSIIELVLNHKIELEESMLISLLNNGKEELASLFIQMGCPVGNEALNAACYAKSKKVVSQVLQCHVDPTREAFNSMFQLTGYYNSSGFAIDANKIAEIVDLLVEAGYQPDYDDVLTALKCHCFINGIERFNIEFTSDFIVECTKQGFYPYPNINVKPTIECLRIECKRVNNLANIKKLVKQGLKPDIECLRNACDSNSNVPTVRYLLEEHKIKPDIECIKKIAGHIRCPNLNIVLQHWNDSKIDTVIPLISSEEVTEESEPIVVNNDKPSEPLNIDNKATELAKLAAELKLDDEFKCFDIDTDNSSKKHDELSPKELKMVTFTIPAKTPTDHKAKMKIKPTIRKLFKIKETNVSFLELRKHITSYITTNGLYNKENSLIRLDSPICKALKINQGYLNFNELDGLVSQAYK
jgi:hypothetical protein